MRLFLLLLQALLLSSLTVVISSAFAPPQRLQHQVQRGLIARGRTPISDIGIPPCCFHHGDCPSLHQSNNKLNHQWMTLRASSNDNESNSSFGPPDAGGVLASLVVLYSEYTLKTTGCGLPAGPFGLYGAVEGISYLAVVGIVGYSIFEKLQGDSGGRNSSSSIQPLVQGLAVLAILIGLAVLVFQIADYGYIPNAVPMDGGMCK